MAAALLAHYLPGLRWLPKYNVGVHAFLATPVISQLRWEGHLVGL